MIRQSLVIGPPTYCKDDLCPRGQKCMLDDTHGSPMCGCKRTSSSTSIVACGGFASVTNGIAYCPSNASCAPIFDRNRGVSVPAVCTVVPGKQKPNKTPARCACKPISSPVPTSRPVCGAAAAPQCNGSCGDGEICRHQGGLCDCMASSPPTSQPASSYDSSRQYEPLPVGTSSYPNDPRACGNTDPKQCGDGECDNNKVCKVYRYNIAGYGMAACGCFGANEIPPSAEQ